MVNRKPFSKSRSGPFIGTGCKPPEDVLSMCVEERRLFIVCRYTFFIPYRRNYLVNFPLDHSPISLSYTHRLNVTFDQCTTCTTVVDAVSVKGTQSVVLTDLGEDTHCGV